MRRKPAVPLSHTLFFMPLLACACFSWSPVALAPKVSGDLPTHSRVVRKGGARVQLYRGRITPDSIIASRGDTGRYAVSRDSVIRVEERHFQPIRTLGVLVGVGVGVVGALFVAFLTSGDMTGWH